MVCLIKCGGCHGLISSGTPSGLCADCAQREVAALRSRSETAEKSLAEARAERGIAIGHVNEARRQALDAEASAVEARAALDEARRLLRPFGEAQVPDILPDAARVKFVATDDPYAEALVGDFRAAAAFLRASDEKGETKPLSSDVFKDSTRRDPCGCGWSKVVCCATHQGRFA